MKMKMNEKWIGAIVLLLAVSKTLAADAAPYIWKKAGGNPYIGTAEEAVKLFSLPEEVKQRVLKILKQEGQWRVVMIPRGQRFEEMVFGQGELRKEVVAQWERHAALAAKSYILREYEILRFDWCNNWAWRKATISPEPKPAETEKVFIRLFFLSLPPKGDPAREALRKDPRAIEMETFRTLNEATRKRPREGRFLFKLFTGESEEEEAAVLAEIRVKGGVGTWSATRGFLSRYRRYEIWPEEEIMERCQFFWPPSGWQKGSVKEFRKMNHRVFIAY